MNLLGIYGVVKVSFNAIFIGICIVSVVFLLFITISPSENNKLKFKKKYKITVIIVSIILIIIMIIFIKYISILEEKVSKSYNKYSTENYYISNDQYKDILNCVGTDIRFLGIQLFKNKENNELKRFSLIINNNKNLKDYSNLNNEEKIITVDVYKNNIQLNSFEKLLIKYPENLYILKSIGN